MAMAIFAVSLTIIQIQASWDFVGPAETIENDAVFDRFGAVFDRFGAAERFRNFAERFRNRSAKFRNRSAQSLSETQRKMSSRFALIPLKGRRLVPTNFIQMLLELLLLLLAVFCHM